MDSVWNDTLKDGLAKPKAWAVGFSFFAFVQAGGLA
jgi:hypothetical protein